MPTIRLVETPEASSTPQPLGLNLKWSKSAQQAIQSILSRYPEDRSRSATIPLLHLAQREFGGWLSVDAMQLVADTLGLPYIRVYEVATFYTMFNLKPVGKYHLQVCTNCACLVRGSDTVMETVKAELGLTEPGQTTPDGLFTLSEVECLGACVAAPMLQNTVADGGSHYYTHLTVSKVKEILTHLKKGKNPAQFADTPPSNPDPITHQSYGN